MCTREKNYFKNNTEGQRKRHNMHPDTSGRKRTQKASKEKVNLPLPVWAGDLWLLVKSQSGQFCIGQDRSPMTNCLQVQERHFTNSAGLKLYFTLWLPKEPGICWRLCVPPCHKKEPKTQRYNTGELLLDKILETNSGYSYLKASYRGEEKNKSKQQLRHSKKIGD